jgi:DNA replication factor GINS
MDENEEITINSLYSIALREIENELAVQEIPTDIYPKISDYIGKLKREEYDGIERKIKDELVNMATDLVSLLIRVRLDKVIDTESIDYSNLSDEEKFILDSEEEKRERHDMIQSGILNGKSKLLESVSQKHKTKFVLVRFVKEMDQIVGVDMKSYGPFNAEDIATIPYENAQALITKDIATKIRWED